MLYYSRALGQILSLFLHVQRFFPANALPRDVHLLIPAYLLGAGLPVPLLFDLVSYAVFFACDHVA